MSRQLTGYGWTQALERLSSAFPAMSSVWEDAGKRQHWRNELERYTDDAVANGISQLLHSTSGDRIGLPRLLMHVKAAKAQAWNETPRPADPSQSVQEWEDMRIAEVQEFCRRNPGAITGDEMAARIVSIRTNGPFFERVIGVQTGADKRTFDQWWRATFGSAKPQRGAGPRSLGEILGVKNLSAGDIVAEYRANPSSWTPERVAGLDEKTRDAVRRELQGAE